MKRTLADEEILTLEEVAKYLKLKPQTVYKWAQEGQIPGTKLGKEWRFRKWIIDDWVDSAIVLSKGGFDALLQSTLAAVQTRRMSPEAVEDLLEEVMR